MVFLLGFLFSLLIASFAFHKQSLNLSGFVASIVCGTLVYGFAGWYAFLALMVFFVSSSLLSRLHPTRKNPLRNAWQVVCNGGIPTFLAILYGVFAEPLLLVLLMISLAAATSDTWSSEIGRLSKKMPRHIFTFKKTTVGLSGSVTILGVFASFLAGTLFALMTLYYQQSLIILFSVFLFAVFGSLFDSALGVLQVKYRHELTHDIVDEVNTHTVYHGGLIWLSNNLVNLISVAVTVLLAALYLFILST